MIMKMKRIQKITNKVGEGLRSKLLKGNEEIVTLLIVYAILILWVLNFNI
jgi:Na+/H+-translocating membrane pyrophosphatase